MHCRGHCRVVQQLRRTVWRLHTRLQLHRLFRVQTQNNRKQGLEVLAHPCSLQHSSLGCPPVGG